MSVNMPPPGASGDPMVDQILSGAGAGAGAAMMGGEPIGGYFAGAGRVDQATGQPLGTGPLDPITGEITGPVPQTVPQGIASHYGQGDETVVWEGLTLEDRVRLQDQLVAFGLTNAVIPGELDDGTLNGLTSLLGLSNRSGTHWRGTLGRLQSLKERGLLESAQKEAREFDPTPFLQPDYASLAQEVKATFRQRLGRDPDQYEMQQLTGELTGFYAAEHEAQNELERIRFEQQTTEGTQSGQSVQSVDPVARFREAFESRYANELDFVEDKESAVQTREIVEGGVGALSQMSGGQ